MANSASDADFREYLLESAVTAGKFPASRKDHYRAAYDRDPKGTAKLIGQLAPGLPGNGEASPDDSYPKEWLGRPDPAPGADRVVIGD